MRRQAAVWTLGSQADGIQDSRNRHINNRVENLFMLLPMVSSLKVDGLNAVARGRNGERSKLTP